MAFSEYVNFKSHVLTYKFYYSVPVPNPSIILIFVYIFQAKNVGVGGYLLGVGVNPIGTTHRHGYGADHVLSYKIVLADGSIALGTIHIDIFFFLLVPKIRVGYKK